MPEKPLVKENSSAEPGHHHGKAIGILLVAFLLVKVILAIFYSSQNYTLASDLTTDNILKAVNEQRSLRNLVTLNINGKLSFAAQSKADDMQARHYFAHVDPDGHYIWDKIVAAGYTPYLQLGENLAIEFYDTDSLVSAWMNSPTHRANLLNDGFVDQGMGLTFGDTAQGQYHSAIANTFGTLAPAPKPKVVAPAPPAPVTTLPAPKKTVTPAPKPKTLGTQASASSTPPQTAAPAPAQSTSSPAVQPIQPREADLLAQNNPQSNFSVPSPAVSSSTAATTSPVAAPGQPPQGLVGKAQNAALSSYQTNRYLVLFAGFILLILLLSDIRHALQNKFSNLDKKFNNLVLLIISLVVVAFMYWL